MNIDVVTVDMNKQRTYGYSYLKDYLVELKHITYVQTAIRQIVCYSDSISQEIQQTKKRNF